MKWPTKQRKTIHSLNCGTLIVVFSRPTVGYPAAANKYVLILNLILKFVGNINT